MYKKEIRTAIIFLLIAVLSFSLISKIASSPKVNAPIIETLDKKQMIVVELTAAAAATSMAVSAIPGDITTPISNQIANLSSYLLVVSCAVFLEKILLATAGFVTFSFIIPLSCLLMIIYQFKKRSSLKTLAFKLSIFGLAILLIVPTSVTISNLIDETFNMQTVFESAKNSPAEIEEINENIPEEEYNKFTGFFKNLKDSITGSIEKAVQKAETALSNFIDAISALIVTACLIPIGVFLSLIWLVKFLFGITIKLPKIPTRKVNKEAIDAPSSDNPLINA